MTIKNKISLFLLTSILFVGCSLKLTESKYGDYSSYEKYESRYKVKNREGLEFGENRIPRVKKQFYHIRMNDSTLLDLKWVSKRPVIGNNYKASIDSSIRIERLSELNTVNDSIIGTFRFKDFNFKPRKIKTPKIDTSEHKTIQKLRNSPPIRLLRYQSRRQIEMAKNGRCYYSDYAPGGPDSGGGRTIKYSGQILIKGDTLTAVFYQDMESRIPVKPFEKKLFMNSSKDTLFSVIDGEISSQYGYTKIK